MSFDEIVSELPKLSIKERKELAVLALELDDDIAFCNEAARQGFLCLDTIETQNAEKPQIGE